MTETSPGVPLAAPAKPSWRQFLPDTRGMIAGALLLLLAYALDRAFGQKDPTLANLLAAGVKDAFLIAIGFYFGASKTDQKEPSP